MYVKFKGLPVKLQQSENWHKPLADEFGSSNKSIVFWVKQAITAMINGQSMTLKNVKQLLKSIAI